MSKLTKVYIPFRGYYSSPFSRWQGSLANENAIVLGANTANRWFKHRKIDPTVIDYLYYGITIAHIGCFTATPGQQPWWWKAQKTYRL